MKDMTTKDLQNLVFLYLRGDLNEMDFQKMTQEFSADQVRKEIDKFIEIEYLLSIKYNTLNTQVVIDDFIKSNVISNTKKREVLKLNLNRWMRYAALFIGVVCMGYFLRETLINDGISGIDKKSTVNKITLNINGSQTKVIDSSKNNPITDERGNVIAVQQGNKLIYKNFKKSNRLSYNEIHIPYGQTFKLQLSDGTNVHLNSGSSIRYPTNFIEGKGRDVFLRGEAFFEVTRDEKNPFIVHADDLNIEVLGTEFNVSAYDGEKEVNTVLLSGSVALDHKDAVSTTTPFKLTPGNLAVWNKRSNEYKVTPVDTGLYTAWMKGKVVFKDEPFKVIKRKIERHYNVIIENHNEQLEQNTFSGEFDKETIEEVIALFDKNFGIKYEFKNNKIFIYE